MMYGLFQKALIIALYVNSVECPKKYLSLVPLMLLSKKMTIQETSNPLNMVLIFKQKESVFPMKFHMVSFPMKIMVLVVSIMILKDITH